MQAQSARGHGRSIDEGHTDGAWRIDVPGMHDRCHVRAATSGGNPMMMEVLCGVLDIIGFNQS